MHMFAAMDIRQAISNIEKDLSAAGVPIAEMLRLVAIDRSTWTRWRSGRTVPRLDRWSSVQDAVSKINNRRNASNLS